MKRFFFHLIMLGLIFVDAVAQQEIHLKTEPKLFTPPKKEISAQSEPDLSVKHWECIEPSGDKIIEGGEKAGLRLTLINKGKGEAQAIKLKITDDINDPAFVFESSKYIERLLPEQSMDVYVQIFADVNLKANQHVLKVTMVADNEYIMDPPAEIVLNTKAYRKPQLTYTKFEMCDTCEGTSAIIADNNLQPGEMVKVKMFVQNNGLNTALNVNYLVSSKDKNIGLKEPAGNMGNVAKGENKSFILFVNPNKAFKGSEVPLLLSLEPTNNLGYIDKFNVKIPVNRPVSEMPDALVKPTQPAPEKTMPDNPIIASEKTMPDDAIIAPVATNLRNIEQAPLSKTKRYNLAAAIVIGIENYTDLPRYVYAENDAKIVTNYFKNTIGISTVETYTSIKASHLLYDKIFNLEDGLLKTKMIAEDKTDLFVFFSGYGMTSSNGEQLFFMPTDGEKDRVSSTGWNVIALFETLKHIGARNIILFFDASFSGISRQSETIKPENLVGMDGLKAGTQIKEPWIENPSFYIYNSTQSNGASFAFDQSQTGLFTYYLCLGLQGAADSNKDRKITTGELALYLQTEVKQSSAKFGNTQIPQFHGNGNYVLVEY